MTLPAVIAVTDPRSSDGDLVGVVGRVFGRVPAGSVGVQLRDKVRPGAAVCALAERLAALCHRYGAPLYVNDRLDIALAVRASGAHLGRGSVGIAEARRLLGTQAFVSVAAHEIADVERARAEGASAALVSPIFESPGKGPPRGTSWLAEAHARAQGLPLYALGGVNATNVEACAAAGATGVAVVRALWEAADPVDVASRLVRAVSFGASVCGQRRQAT
ncbi:MAG TPA: thiamine phosphate synthase [Polyangiaceae bacterium]|nr:thiamine phosphate synthase [Polyangiaceae bacterium]